MNNSTHSTVTEVPQILAVCFSFSASEKAWESPYDEP